MPKRTQADRLFRRLDTITTLSEDDREAIAALPFKVAEFEADRDIVREGDHATRSFVVLEGFACSYRITGSGRRQILSFHFLGDWPDLQSLHLQKLDFSLSTITPCSVGFIEHSDIHALCAKRPQVAGTLWRSTLVDAAIFREWMTNVGQRPAYSRIAHLLCELFMRTRVVDATSERDIELPISQTELGDATGLSTVHVNRQIQALRAEGLIEWKGSRLTVLDWRRLAEIGDFDGNYLHVNEDRIR